MGGGTLDYSEAGSLTVNLSTKSATNGAFTDHFSNFNTIVGGASVTIDANTTGYTLNGGGGTLEVGLSNATVDLAIGTLSSAGVSDNFSDFSTLFVGSHPTYIDVDTTGYTLTGGAGNDTLYIGLSNATVDLLNGTISSGGVSDTFTSGFTNIVDGTHATYIDANTTGYTLTAGSSGNDTLYIGLANATVDLLNGTVSSAGVSDTFTSGFTNIIDGTNPTYVDVNTTGYSLTGGASGNDTLFVGLSGATVDLLTETVLKSGASDSFSGFTTIEGGTNALYVNADANSYNLAAGSGGGTLQLASNDTVDMTGSSGTVSGGVTDTFSNFTTLQGASTYNLDSSELANLSGIGHIIGASSASPASVTISSGSGADTDVASQLSNIFSNVNNINLTNIDAGSSWAAGQASISGSAVEGILGGYSGTLTLTLASGGSLQTSLENGTGVTFTQGSLSAPTIVGAGTANETITWNDAAHGNSTVNLIITH